MAEPLITTIIPVFNRPRLLGEAVGSVLAQSHRPIEILIVDDGSTDDTASVAEGMAASHPEIRVLRQRNMGAGQARETGRKAARGEFIQHLDSDDLLLPRKFEMQLAAFQSKPSAGVAYGWTRLRLPDGSAEAAPYKRSGENLEFMFPAMLQSRWWSTPNPLYRREVLENAGPWADLRVEEDWEYDARIAALGLPLVHCADWVCEVRRHEDGHLSARGLAPEVLSHRARAHELILGHALRAGIQRDQPEMRHFARELFLLARQCGAAGLSAESRRLLHLAQSVSGARDMRLYARTASIIGWERAGKISALLDKLR